jgi:starch-binding outer membrane protein, SusD/RagB family
MPLACNANYNKTKNIYTMKQYIIIYAVCFAATTMCSCKKGFLDEKPKSDILIPNTLADFQRLLDNTVVISRSGALAHLACDDYYFTSATAWQAASTQTERNSYIWDTDIFGGETDVDDWNALYQAVFYTNAVLKGLSLVPVEPTNKAQWNNIKGWALFARSFAFFDLARNFSPIYNSNTAATDLGIPLKLEPDIDVIVKRSSVKQTYDKILADLTEASQLLTTTFQINNRNRPSKVSAMALFSRIYLYMGQYDKAELYADSCLLMYNKLINYNTLSATASTPFSINNDEVLYHCIQVGKYYSVSGVGSTGGNTGIDTALINLYNQVNDLRFSIFFTKPAALNIYWIKRGYAGTGLFPFTGLATDEVYLTKAECAARRADTTIALSYLNDLLVKRFKTGTFVRVTASSVQDALDKIILERRKELVWRNQRWHDIKRYNKEGANITLTRVLGGQTYTLVPNSPRYTFNIPADEIALSGIEQNNR